MYVEIHGARGSMPVGTAEFSRFGGDTTCYSVHHDDGSLIAIVDAGTGLRMLERRMSRGTTVDLVMTHYHWDHIQGLSTCAPMWRGEISLRILGPGDPERLLAPAIAPPWFPVAISEVDVEFVSSHQSFSVGGVEVRAFALHHPQGATGYRFDHEGRSVVVATDHEAGTVADDAVVEASRGADLLIHDAQYLPSEIQDRKGWGHSTWEQAVDMACRAGVRSLVLASHDPSRSDGEIDEIVSLARDRFTNTTAASARSRLSLGE